MWCKNCERETMQEKCEICGKETEADIPAKIYRCPKCNIPIVRMANDIDRNICPRCDGEAIYMASDLRPVFPEERLLVEILLDKPPEFLNSSVWANDNRYYVDDKIITLASKYYKKYTPDYICQKLKEYKEQNTYEEFNEVISKLCDEMGVAA